MKACAFVHVTVPGQTTGEDKCFCRYESAYVPFYSSEAGAELKNILYFFTIRIIIR